MIGDLSDDVLAEMPGRLRLLADWFDTKDPHSDDEVQSDLRRWADLAERELVRLRGEDEAEAHLRTIDQRDEAIRWADNLAYAIAPESVIGEHSNVNDPWANALEIALARGDAGTPRLERVGCIGELGELMRGHFGPCEGIHEPLFRRLADPGSSPETEGDER